MQRVEPGDITFALVVVTPAYTLLSVRFVSVQSPVFTVRMIETAPSTSEV